MGAWNEARFWPAFKQAGLLYRAEIARENGEKLCFAVGYYEPDVTKAVQFGDQGVRSKEYSIEYQADDVPGDLTEGTEILLTGDRFPRGALFRVRAASYVPEVPFQGDSGFFRRVPLTRI